MSKPTVRVHMRKNHLAIRTQHFKSSLASGHQIERKVVGLGRPLEIVRPQKQEEVSQAPSR